MGVGEGVRVGLVVAPLLPLLELLALPDEPPPVGAPPGPAGPAGAVTGGADRGGLAGDGGAPPAVIVIPPGIVEDGVTIKVLPVRGGFGVGVGVPPVVGV